jgi:hypothetical protein
VSALQGTNKSYSVFEVERRLLIAEADAAEIAKRRETRNSMRDVRRKSNKVATFADAGDSTEISVPIGAVPVRHRGSHPSSAASSAQGGIGGFRTSDWSEEGGDGSAVIGEESSDVLLNDTLCFAATPPMRSNMGYAVGARSAQDMGLPASMWPQRAPEPGSSAAAQQGS